MRQTYLLAAAMTLALVPVAILAGCSHHDAPTATPVDSAATPTNRSFTNSTDQPNTPFYTQPGVNPGKKTTLKPIASQAGFSQNTPLATTVYNALSSSGILDTRYITVQTKGKIVLLQGTVTKAGDIPVAERLAKSQKGVGSVEDKLTVKSGGT